jgi:DNA-binding CsgD family transcriptional regulator
MRHSEAQCRASTTVSIEDLTNVIPCSGDHFGWVRREHDRATVVKVMTGISPRDRIICKHLMSGLSMTETGAKVGMSRQAVCYAVDRLREKVRRIGITWEAA